MTTVWSYGSVNHPGTFNYPAFAIEAGWQAPVRVKWINGLVDGHGNYVSHLLAVDPTLHWANPPGPRVVNGKTWPKLNVDPGQVTRVGALFDVPGQFVWHCHIVEHEDNEMMRPLRVGP